jgi:hypothetical protein
MSWACTQGFSFFFLSTYLFGVNGRINENKKKQTYMARIHAREGVSQDRRATLQKVHVHTSPRLEHFNFEYPYWSPSVRMSNSDSMGLRPFSSTCCPRSHDGPEEGCRFRVSEG